MISADVETLARRQHGLITRAQLVGLGVPTRTIDRHVHANHLYRIHQGVYAVGRPELAPNGHRLAAVLAYGTTAVLSHHSTGAIWDLVGGALWPLHVTVPGSGRAHRAGIRVHRTTTLHSEDVTTVDRIPVTSIDRTLLDLAAVLPRRRLIYAVEQADRLQKLNLAGLQRVLARNHGARGAGKLRALLENYDEPPDVRSRLERDFLALVDAHGLPRPRLNVVVEGHRVDAFWPDWGLVVELDGVGFHLNRGAFEDDRVRDAAMQRVGNRVLRVTEKRLSRQPTRVLDDVLTLAQRRD